MLLQGMHFAVIGMSVVFLLLTFLVIVVKFVSFLIQRLSRFIPEEFLTTDTDEESGTDQEIAIVIAAASAYSKS